MASALALSTGGGGGRGIGEPRMPSTRRRRPDTVGRARGAAVAERGEGGGRGAGRPGWLRWLGRLVGTGPLVNSPLSLFLNLFFPKSLNETFEAFAYLFRSCGKKKNCSPPNFLQLCFNR